MWRAAAVASVWAWMCAGAVVSAQFISPEVAERQGARFAVFNRLWVRAQTLHAAGKLDAATTEVLEQEASSASVWIGDNDSRLLERFGALAGWFEQAEDFESAVDARQAILDIATRVHGTDGWQSTDARLALDHARLLTRLSPDQRQQLASAQRSSNQASTAYERGDYAQAIQHMQSVLEIRKSILGKHHRDYAESLNGLGFFYKLMGNYAQAEPAYLQSIALRKSVLGPQHPDYGISLGNLAELYREMGELARAEPLVHQASEILKAAYGPQDARYATSLNNLGALYEAMGDSARAEPLYQQALAIRKVVLGEQDVLYASSLNNLAGLYRSRGEYAAAEPMYRQAMEICKLKLGEQHPTYALSLNNLADLYRAMGDYSQAEPLCRQVCEIWKQTLGQKHPHYATSLSNLAGLYRSMGDYARAEPLFQQALAIHNSVLGQRHPESATSRNNLADLYAEMGDFARAELLYHDSLAAREATLGKTHYLYTQSLNNLASFYYSTGDYQRAEPLHRQVLEVYRSTLGEQHPDYALALHNLAELYRVMGQHARAEPLCRQAIELLKTNVGEHDPMYALGLTTLAFLYGSLGDPARAEPLFQQVVSISKTALGDGHPDHARALSNLADLYVSSGDYARAEPLARQAMEIIRRSLDQTAAVQSQRQQLAMSYQRRRYLDCWLVDNLALPGADAQANVLYAEVLSWKGMVTLRQIRARLALSLAQSLNPQVGEIARRYADATRRLATLVGQTPPAQQADAHQRELTRLAQQVEDLQRELACQSHAFAQQLEQARRTPDEIGSALPEATALVDLLVYERRTRADLPRGEKSWQQRLLAFVVRHDRPLVCIDLGPMSQIEQAVDAWRQSFGLARGGANPGHDLRRLVWEPLEAHLTGCDTVLISPDGALSQLPFAALPGSEPGTYLLEQRAIAIVPVVQQLPELLAHKVVDRNQPSLLLLGNIDYGGDPGPHWVASSQRSAPRGDVLGGWSRLPGTIEETKAIERVFSERFNQSDVRVLSETSATEAALRQLAPRHRYLHLATHGYFAPQTIRALTHHDATPEAQQFVTRQDATGYHPDLLSGIVLTGANQPVETDRDDGVLTALEVGELDLNGVELVVLSACQTGLGQCAGGEGLLGLQRAFQVAGAQSVVASLWSVSDDATRTLMIDFYDNLWNKRLSKIEALRQAQLAMLRDGIRRAESDAGDRGLKLVDDQPATANRLPPYYWAAFVLSGAWE